MKRYLIDFKDKLGKRHRAKASGHELLTADEKDAVEKHLKANGLKIAGKRVITTKDDWEDWLKPARPDVDLKHLDLSLRKRLADACRELGHPGQAVSGYRSRDKQQKLYNDYKAGKGPLAAAPGHSNHEKGEAADVYVQGVPIGSYPGGRDALRKHGLVLGAVGEKWHVERKEIGTWRA